MVDVDVKKVRRTALIDGMEVELEVWRAKVGGKDEFFPTKAKAVAACKSKENSNRFERSLERRLLDTLEYAVKGQKRTNLDLDSFIEASRGVLDAISGTAPGVEVTYSSFSKVRVEKPRTRKSVSLRSRQAGVADGS